MDHSFSVVVMHSSIYIRNNNERIMLLEGETTIRANKTQLILSEHRRIPVAATLGTVGL